MINCADIEFCMWREGCKIIYLRKYTNTQLQSCTNTQIHKYKMKKYLKMRWHCVLSVCADGCWITGLPQPHKDGHKHHQHTQIYTPVCEYTKIISPLAHILYKAP